MAMTDSKSVGAIVLLCIYVTGAIRNLKEGPMMGPDSRQYKTAPLRTDDPTDMHATTTAPVMVLCTERTMIVIIRADLYSNGRLVRANELHLGRSNKSCNATQYSDTEYVIEADLHQCGSELSIKGDHLVYSNRLIYTPTQKSYGIVRTSGAAIPIECHYKRTHFVSSINVRPSTGPLSSTKSAKEIITFNFQLMNDDWWRKKSSYVYQLGEMMNIQASFLKAGHAPYRLIMDSCVATLKPDSTSVPRYVFIQNHGCLTDSKVPGSFAHFLPRKQNHILQMQMDAFHFNEDKKDSIYITCHLKIVDLKVNIMNKACTYTEKRWLSVDGEDEVCECCENVCDDQKLFSKWGRPPNLSVCGDSTVCKTMMLGPIKVLG